VRRRPVSSLALLTCRLCEVRDGAAVIPLVANVDLLSLPTRTRPVHCGLTECKSTGVRGEEDKQGIGKYTVRAGVRGVSLGAVGANVIAGRSSEAGFPGQPHLVPLLTKSRRES
jgi:hypothetical protein